MWRMNRGKPYIHNIHTNTYALIHIYTLHIIHITYISHTYAYNSNKITSQIETVLNKFSEIIQVFYIICAQKLDKFKKGGSFPIIFLNKSTNLIIFIDYRKIIADRGESMFVVFVVLCRFSQACFNQLKQTSHPRN